MNDAHPFHRTTASTIERIDQLVSTMPGAAAYKTLVGANDREGAPRNAAQCQYQRQKRLKKQKITNDEIVNIILLLYELHRFYKLIQFQREVLIVLMHDQMKQQFSEVLLKTKQTVPLYFDTTFSLGEIYVSAGRSIFS